MMAPFRTVLIVVEQLGQLTHPCRIVVISMYAEKAEIARFRALNVDGYPPQKHQSQTAFYYPDGAVRFSKYAGFMT